jgi:hypothetical protein
VLPRPTIHQTPFKNHRIKKGNSVSNSPTSQRAGIGYSAYSEEQSKPIVTTIIKVDGLHHYRLDGPDNLAHVSEGRFDVIADRSLCEATILALKSPKPSRTWRLREELFAERARAAARGEFSNDARPPKLTITIRTRSPTFVQMGEYFSTHARVETKGGRLEPSMRALHTQLQRFDARWELIENGSADTDTN